MPCWHALRKPVPMIDPVRWLAPAVAADMFPAGTDGKAAEQAIREVLGSLPVDIIVQPRATRRKRLFLADMDSTMIAQECIDELADFVGRKAEVSESPSAPCAANSPSSRPCASGSRCSPDCRPMSSTRSSPPASP